MLAKDNPKAAEIIAKIGHAVIDQIGELLKISDDAIMNYAYQEEKVGMAAYSQHMIDLWVKIKLIEHARDATLEHAGEHYIEVTNVDNDQKRMILNIHGALVTVIITDTL